MKVIGFLLIVLACAIAASASTAPHSTGPNPNTAVSGTDNFYTTYGTGSNGQTTRGVQLTNPSTYDKIGESFTIEMWFRKTCGPGSYRPLISKHNQDPFTEMNKPNGLAEYVLEVQFNDSINFFTGCGGFSDYGYFVGSDQRAFYPNRKSYKVVKDRWTHVAVSVSWKEDVACLPLGVASLYIDGVLVDSAMWAADAPQCYGKKRLRNIGEPVRIGMYDNQDAGFQTFCGDIDELRFWDVARSPQQIKEYYQGGVPLNSAGLVSYHTFFEGTGSPFSANIASADGFPKVVFNEPFSNDWVFFQPSSLKLAPAPLVACKNYPVSGAFLGGDAAQQSFDFYIVKMVRNTDAKIMFTDKRNPIERNIRREITKFDLPLNVGRGNLIEYFAGDVVGTDIIYYEARNNASFSEPKGPATIVFKTACCGKKSADSCRVCGGDGKSCEASCDKAGGQYDECGVCNGDGKSCRGCDNRAYSPLRFDSCGICGGDGKSCFASCPNGVIDQCGVCNGNNECCLQYKGIPKERLENVLLNYTVSATLAKLETIESLIVQAQRFVDAHNKRYRLDEFDPTGVVLPSALPASLSSHIIETNKVCDKTSDLIAMLDIFLADFGTQVSKQFPEKPFPHVIY